MELRSMEKIKSDEYSIVNEMNKITDMIEKESLNTDSTKQMENIKTLEKQYSFLERKRELVHKDAEQHLENL